MQLRSIVEMLTAGHLTYLVNAPVEFSGRGGMMFVAPTGQLKTAITKTLDAWRPYASVCSDLTIRELGEMRESIAQGKVRTLAFMELQKLYARNKEIAANVEGALHQMVDEGFRIPNWLPQNLTVKEAKAFVVGCMPPKFYARHFGEWTNTGWARRFLWCHFQLANPELILDSIDHWQPIDFGKQVYHYPISGAIPFNCTQADSTFLREILRRTKADYEALPFILLKKICSVLKWRYSELGKSGATSKMVEIISDFAECLQGVAELQVELTLTGSDEKKPARSARAKTAG